MLMSASSEFISICRSQIALLTQGLGAALSVVYLSEQLLEEGGTQDRLIPVAAYPETAVIWEPHSGKVLLPAANNRDFPQLRSETLSEKVSTTAPLSLPELLTDTKTAKEQPDRSNNSLLQASKSFCL